MDYTKLTDKELDNLIFTKCNELIALRKEQSRRNNDTPDYKRDIDYTKYITD